jgi:biofilm PGA synthesis N-glycosyltransferase PgaC
MVNGLQTIFWFCALALIYTYVGYPIGIWIWARIRPRRAVTGPYEPMLSVVLVAHDEANRVQQRLENLLDFDYPRDRVEVLIASDGSTDATVELARQYPEPQVRVFDFRARRGKSAVLNDVIAQARGEIVVLTDARQYFEPSTLRALAVRFADPRVGAVSGELILLDSAGTSEVGGVDFYWRYEKFIRRHESLIDSTIGTTGAVYAIRHSLFKPIPAAIILDDVLIPMQIASMGYRVLFEPHARAYDRTSATAQREFVRKLRTIAGNFQLFFHERWLLNPFTNRLWLQTVSHKVSRLLSPVFLFAAFVDNCLLIHESWYGGLFALQVSFYIAAFLGRLTRGSMQRPFFLNIPYAFCLLNWATVIAFVQFLEGRQRVTWKTLPG